MENIVTPSSIEDNARHLYLDNPAIHSVSEREKQYEAYMRGASDQQHADYDKFIEFIKGFTGRYVSEYGYDIDRNAIINDFNEFIKIPDNKRIHEKFVKLTYESLKKEIAESNQRKPTSNVHCILPFLYKDRINGELKVYGAYANAYLNEDDETILVYPAREFPSGKVNDEGKVKYKFTADHFDGVYSFDNISPMYRVGMAMGGLLNMVNPFEKMVYIYDLEKENEAQQSDEYSN